MRSKMFRKSVYIPLLALGLTSVAPAAVAMKTSPAIKSQNWNSENEASSLLKEVKDLSAKLKADGSRLEALALHKKRSVHSHSYELSEARTHINAIGQRLDRLQAIQSAAASWQQKAIGEIVPIAANVAAHTESAIQHLNDNRGYLHAPDYLEHLAEIGQQSDELKSAVDAYLEFGSTAGKHKTLQQKLDRMSDQLGIES